MDRGNGRRWRKWRTAIDLSSGSGAVTVVLRAARFGGLAAADSDPEAVAAYRSDCPSARLYDDIRERTSVRLRTALREATVHLLLFAAGEGDSDVPLHATRTHFDVTLKRLAAVSRNGRSRVFLPADPIVADYAKLRPRAFPDGYGRMPWDNVAQTLPIDCTDATRCRYSHPHDDRDITPREAVPLLTFSGGYGLVGNYGATFRQIGDAVRARLVVALSKNLRKHTAATPV